MESLEQLKIIYNSTSIERGGEDIQKDGSIEYKEKPWTSN